MAPNDQGNTQNNVAELDFSVAPPLGKNEEAGSVPPFNLSSLATESLSATVFQSYSTSDMEDMNGFQLRLSNSRTESLQGDTLLCQDDLLRRDTSYAGTSNDDVTWLLLGLSTRLDNLEIAVANGDARIAHLNAQTIALTNDFRKAIKDLKKGVKELANEILTGGLCNAKAQT
ncbi:hypothetical protein MKX08_006555 [Trichoderma sp. CBMAI-0020]|nr:hypothetical protein MKX08_006555 [Trichoderma sp. CBMAI-0020]WOD46107.1 hypothetical protein [Trichoderma atroviride]